MIDVIQPALIPDCVPTRRGREATPQVERTWTAPRPNPGGRSKLTFRFRPLQRHCGPAAAELANTTLWPYVARPRRLVWNIACNLIAEFFQHVGGFRVADDAVVAAWADLVAAGDFTAQEIRWAIAAKAASLADPDEAVQCEKRKYRGKPESFPRNVAYWLEQAPEYQALLVEKKLRQRSRTIDDVVAHRRQAERSDAAGRHARAEQRRQARTAAADRRRMYWERLSGARRQAARRAVEPRFKERCGQWGENPEDPKMDPVLRDMAIDWATYKWPPKDERTEE